MSNFEFLRVYWPSLTEIGKSAEIYVYTDPNTCIYKLGQMSEIIVREICVLEKIIIQPGSTHQSNINLLRRHGLISKNKLMTFFLRFVKHVMRLSTVVFNLKNKP